MADDAVDGLPDDAFEIDYDDLSMIGKLGQGAFGTVYKADYFGSMVAVKKLMNIDDAGVDKYVQRELAISKSIAHPNICQFMGLCKHEGGIYVISECMDMGDLQKLLLDLAVPLPWLRRATILLEAIKAITFLHMRGMMHRDIKAENLLLDANGRVKLADFGFARKVDKKLAKYQNAKIMTIAGTDDWMAPEVTLGTPYGQKADIFSFGITCTEVLLRSKPLERPPQDCFEFQVESFRSELSPACPSELTELTIRCCAYEPDARPTAKQVMAELKDIVNGIAESDKKRLDQKAEIARRNQEDAAVVETRRKASELRLSGHEIDALSRLSPKGERAKKSDALPNAELPLGTGVARYRWRVLGALADCFQDDLELSIPKQKKPFKFRCVLQGDVFYYFRKNKPDEKNIGRITLDKSAVFEMRGKGKKCSVSIDLFNKEVGASRLHYSLGGRSEAVLSRWLNEMKERAKNSDIDKSAGVSQNPFGRTPLSSGPNVVVFQVMALREGGTKKDVIFCISPKGVHVLQPFVEECLVEAPFERITEWSQVKGGVLQLTTIPLGVPSNQSPRSPVRGVANVRSPRPHVSIRSKKVAPSNVVHLQFESQHVALMFQQLEHFNKLQLKGRALK